MNDYELRFWERFGPILFGQPRAPKTAQEWIDAGRQLKALTALDHLAQRLEQAAQQPIQRPQARQRSGFDGDVHYGPNGEACCPVHQSRPLKQGKWGWFCSAKDDSTDSGYCNFKARHI